MRIPAHVTVDLFDCESAGASLVSVTYPINEDIQFDFTGDKVIDSDGPIFQGDLASHTCYSEGDRTLKMVEFSQ